MSNEESTKKLYGCSVVTAVLLHVCVASFLVVLATPNFIETSARSSMGTNSVDFGLFYSCAMNDYNSAFECAYIDQNCDTSTSFVLAAYGYTMWQTTNVISYNYTQFQSINGQHVQIFTSCDLFNATRAFFTAYAIIAFISTLFAVVHTCALTKFRNVSFVLTAFSAFVVGVVGVVLASVFKKQANFFYGSSPDTSEDWGYSMYLFAGAFGLFSLTSAIFGVISNRLLVNEEKAYADLGGLDSAHGTAASAPLISDSSNPFGPRW